MPFVLPRLRLRDLNPALVAAWRTAFADAPTVDIGHGSILDDTADAIVSPANSFGFMDGGIDLAYARFFGWDLETHLRELLAAEHAGELPVGQAVIVPTGHKGIPYLVSAPTMRVPGAIAGTPNVFLAFRAALLAVRKFNESASTPIQSLLVPGLGTGIGAVSPAHAAWQMRLAFDRLVNPPDPRRSARDILREHRQLVEGNPT